MQKMSTNGAKERWQSKNNLNVIFMQCVSKLRIPNCFMQSWSVVEFFWQDAMSETFYLSNIVPQDIDNNAGFWNRFEIYCRDLTKKFDHVRIISGPLFISYTKKNGKRNVKYEVSKTGLSLLCRRIFRLHSCRICRILV